MDQLASSPDSNKDPTDKRSVITQTILSRVDCFGRPPTTLQEAWKQVQQEGNTSTAKIFLDTSFSSWFAHLVALRSIETSTKFEGKADCRRLLTQLETESEDFRRSVAVDLNAQIAPDIEEKIRKIHERLLHEPASHTSKRRRLDDDNTSELDYTASPEESASPSPPFPPTRHILCDASLDLTTELFPPLTSAAIRRVPHSAQPETLTAAVAMSFPAANYDTYDCQLSMEIMEHKVERIARDLFEVDLETTDGLRYVCGPSGGRLLPNPHLTLQGCRYDVIPRIFGKKVFDAICGSLSYQKEVKQRLLRSSHVSMVISHKAKDGAQLFVSLGLREGSQIRDELFI
ncbi:hypothetical protein JX266_012083 [Neoarthrinium moseri]|nr:hypothetical protein JX266_012083 [Neoarthrinium moseri]